MIHELLQATGYSRQRSVPQPVDWPEVIALAKLEGWARGDEVLMGPDEFVGRLLPALTGGRITAGDDLPVDAVLRGETIEQSFQVQPLPLEMLKCKLNRFREEYRADVVEDGADSVTLTVSPPVSFWKRLSSAQQVLKVSVSFTPPREAEGSCRVTVNVGPFDEEGPPLLPDLLALRPRLLQGVRKVLHVLPDRRREPRWPCDGRVRLYPVWPDGRSGSPIEGQLRDASRRGLGVTVAESLDSEHAYLWADTRGGPGEVAVLIKVVRCNPFAGGLLWLGMTFGAA
jgi:hypothetical protein